MWQDDQMNSYPAVRVVVVVGTLLAAGRSPNDEIAGWPSTGQSKRAVFAMGIYSRPVVSVIDGLYQITCANPFGKINNKRSMIKRDSFLADQYQKDYRIVPCHQLIDV